MLGDARSTVVRAVPAARVFAVTSGCIALLTLAVTVVSVLDRPGTAADIVLVAVLWSGGMLLVQGPLTNSPPPLRISAEELPPSAPLWWFVVPRAALYAAACAGAAAWSLTQHSYLILSMVLGLPAGLWIGQRVARRRETERGLTLWRTTSVAWKSGDTVWYLLDDGEPPAPAGKVAS